MTISKSSRQISVLWLNSPFSLEYKVQTIDECGENDVFCETLVTAISPGTELAAYKGKEPLRPGSQFPRLQGYCNVSLVKEIGAKVAAVKPGDRVLTFQSHRTGFMTNASEILYVLQSYQDSRKIVCAYLYHLGYNAVLRSNIKPGSRVLIIGMGVLGTTSLQMSQIAGAIIDVITDNELAHKLAKTMGARNVYSRTEFDNFYADTAQPIHDVVITTVNGWDDWLRALKAARKLGTIAMLGFPGRGETKPDFNPLDPQYVYAKQLRIESVGESPKQLDSRGHLRFNEKDNLSFIIDCIDREIINTSKITDKQFSYKDIEAAYRALIERKFSAATILIGWDDK